LQHPWEEIISNFDGWFSKKWPVFCQYRWILIKEVRDISMSNESINSWIVHLSLSPCYFNLSLIILVSTRWKSYSWKITRTERKEEKKWFWEAWQGFQGKEHTTLSLLPEAEIKPRRKLKSNCGFFFVLVLVLQKRKEGVKQVLNSLAKQLPQLSNKIENQEKLVDKILLHQMTVHLFLLVRLLTYFLSTDDFKIRIYHLRV